MTKEELIKNFDPNGPASNDGIFGLPFEEEHANLVIVPVPWEVTVSYVAGTAGAPEAIKEASFQVDLFDPAVKDAWKLGVWMAPINGDLAQKSNVLRAKAENYIESLSGTLHVEKTQTLEEINAACAGMVQWVQEETAYYLVQGKNVVLLGGDHSTPLGFIKALAQQYPEFGILQIDAHADLRIAYEGFEYSHASIMYNALKVREVSKLVQVGIRDYCEEEVAVMHAEGDRVKTFFDRDIKHAQYAGKTWAEQVAEIIAELPQEVYVSFDIDGLDPKLCPHTGTPVAGGFETEQVLYLIEEMLKSGRKMIGLDVNEVGSSEDEWDANVGARLLYRLCNLLGNQ